MSVGLPSGGVGKSLRLICSASATPPAGHSFSIRNPAAVKARKRPSPYSRDHRTPRRTGRDSACRHPDRGRYQINVDSKPSPAPSAGENRYSGPADDRDPAARVAPAKGTRQPAGQKARDTQRVIAALGLSAKARLRRTLPRSIRIGAAWVIRYAGTILLRGPASVDRDHGSGHVMCHRGAKPKRQRLDLTGLA
ncbi:MAG: hypothetical protein HLUCCO07_06285 [Rhodobacteraceae bacterium HLUCCO07]|nr:MAG: hypothetical protein HLUCCO07_06285 [Rhodobacteraceae bacterium HLUCCO07]